MEDLPLLATNVPLPVTVVAGEPEPHWPRTLGTMRRTNAAREVVKRVIIEMP